MKFDHTNGKKPKYKVSIYSFNMNDANIFNEDGFESAKTLFAWYITRYGDKGVVIRMDDLDKDVDDYERKIGYYYLPNEEQLNLQ